jgi:hypothetical protein
MHLTINLDSNDSPELIEKLAASLLTLVGREPRKSETEVIELNPDATPRRSMFDDAMAAVAHAERVAAGDFGLRMDDVLHECEGVHAMSAPHERIPASVSHEFGTLQVGRRAPEERESEIDAAAILAAGVTTSAPLDPPPPPPPPPSDAPSPADAAPSTSAPAAGSATSPSIVDKDGLPWDERIHSGSRGFNKDGTWRRRKNVDPATVAAIEVELRGGTPPPPAAPAPPPPTPGDGLTLGDVVQRVQDGTIAGTIDPAKTSAALLALGVPSLMELGKRPDLFRTFLANLGI